MADGDSMMADYYRLLPAAGMPAQNRVCDAVDYCGRHAQ
ncbi:hypothetical protein I35_4746 [Burkholderia cenocepacia H111]|nr:hypothetical protein I35_4746 [Burkholderia cenocepacia H111]